MCVSLAPPKVEHVVQVMPGICHGLSVLDIHIRAMTRFSDATKGSEEERASCHSSPDVSRA